MSLSPAAAARSSPAGSSASGPGDKTGPRAAGQYLRVVRRRLQQPVELLQGRREVTLLHGLVCRREPGVGRAAASSSAGASAGPPPTGSARPTTPLTTAALSSWSIAACEATGPPVIVCA